MKKSGPNKKDATAKVKNTRQDHNEESSIQDDSDTAAAIAATAAAVTSHPIPKIMPGERLSDFSLRVDQSLPLTGVPKHKTRETVAGLNIKTPLTKHNKRLARMQRDWRTQEEKIRDREEEAEDDLAERKEEDGLLWLGVEAGQMRGKGKNKKKQDKEDEADPWKVLERKRREQERDEGEKSGTGAGFGGGRTGQTRGLNARDNVQAPRC